MPVSPKGFRGLYARRAGMTIIEAAVIMAMVALAIAPIVQMIGGPLGDNGNVSRVSGLTNKNMVFANASIEQALAGNLNIMTCGGTMTLPAKGAAAKSCQGVDTTTSSAPIYYEWIVQNTSGNLPDAMQNDLYDATLNVYADSSYAQTLFTLPTTIFNNTGFTGAGIPKTGIMMILDGSASMGAPADEFPWPTSTVGLNAYMEFKWKTSSPFFKYQYTDPAYPAYTPPFAGLNIDNDAELDIVSYKQNDDPATTNDDRYPRLGAPLKTGQLPNTCAGYKTSNLFDWQNLTHVNSNGPSAYGPITPPDTVSISNKRWIVEKLCSVTSDAQLASLYQLYMSRLEVSRSSFLRMLLTIESDSQFSDNIKLGFISYGDASDKQVPATITGAMEAANVSHRYPNMRRRLSWINRDGPGSIMASNQSNMWQAVYDGAKILYNQPDVESRVIVLLTDGVMSAYTPCAFETGDNALNAQLAGDCFLNNGAMWGQSTGLSRALGNGTFPGYPGKKIMIHTVGILEPDETGVMIPFLKQGLSDPTGGTYSFAATVSEIESVFDGIKYTILKQALITQVARYGISAN
ncbi:MAG: hypothetical protein AB7P76_13055 [Candidatus Melainabacteria bacterium]